MTREHENNSAQFSDDDAVEEQAGMWLARRDRKLSAKEEIVFLTWLRIDPRHRIAFESLEGPFRALDHAAAFRPANAVAIDPDLLRCDDRAPKKDEPTALTVDQEHSGGRPQRRAQAFAQAGWKCLSLTHRSPPRADGGASFGIRHFLNGNYAVWERRREIPPAKSGQR
jgi:ferric-dicitrate binding protein FerR (iron transport regulator)